MRTETVTQAMQVCLGEHGEVHSAVSRWRQVARGEAVGMSAAESQAFEAAFEHEETRSAKRRLA
jgi:hypothetical protein